MTPSEIDETQPELPLPIRSIDPPALAAEGGIVPSGVDQDRKLDALIKHFRSLEARRFAERSLLTNRLSRLRRAIERFGHGLLYGAKPPRQVDDLPWPRISIVLPILDDRPGPAAALRAILEQAYADIEIIVIVRAAAAAVRRWLAPFGDQIEIREIGAGETLGEALAAGFARATGEVLAWSDPAGFYLPGTLERVGTHFRRREAEPLLVLDLVELVQGWPFAAVPRFDHQGLFFSRAAFDAAGGIDEALAGSLSHQEFEAVLLRRLIRRYAWRHLPVHGAVRSRNEAGSPEQVQESMPALRPEPPGGLPWFPPEDAAAVPMRPSFEVYPPPPCPLTGAQPERFLFASPDCRFGTPGLHDIWYHAETHCASVSPPLHRNEIRRLGLTQPPLGERQIVIPGEDTPSPWRNAGFGARFLAFALDHPLPGWLLDRWPLKGLIGWTDRTGRELEQAVQGLLPKRKPKEARPIRFLEIGSHTGEVLDEALRLGWKTFGTEQNAAAAEAARAKGHTLWVGAPDDLLQTIPPEERFDIVFLGHTVERQADPLAMILRAARLLEPRGLLVVATANLDSAQIRLFGPTWAHWHPPFHRTILSRRTLERMARAAGLVPRRCRSGSHPYWSWLSVKLNEAGLSGIVPSGIVPDSGSRAAIETMTVVNRLLHDWRGRGDYLYMVMSPDLRR